MKMSEKRLLADMADFIRGDYHPPTRAQATSLLARFRELEEGGEQSMNESVYKRQLFVCSLGSSRFLCWAMGREDAKRQAHSWLGDNPDHYVVTPISEQGDRVHIALTLSI